MRLGILVCCIKISSGHVFSDERLKTDIINTNTSSLLESIRKLELHEFDYKYDQFYNPIFGKRQLGVIAQEIKNILPRSVGVVPKRAVGNTDAGPTMLENVHVVNTEVLFMANIGATQELAKRLDAVSGLEQEVRLQANLKQEFKSLIENFSEFQMTYSKEKEELQKNSLGKIDELQVFKIRQEALLQTLSESFERFKTNILVDHDKLATKFEQQLRKIDEAILTKESAIKLAVSELSKDIAALKTELSELQVSVGKLAGEEIVEQRKLQESQTRMEEAKIELTKVQQTETRKTLELTARLEIEKVQVHENSTLLRFQKEHELKIEQEKQLLISRKEYELEMHRAKADMDREQKVLDVEAAKVTAVSVAHIETQRERDNHDLRMDMARLQAEESRAHTVSAIKATASEAVAAIQLMTNDPANLIGVIVFLVSLASALFVSKEASVLARKYFQMQMGKPSLVRESSKDGRYRIGEQMLSVMNKVRLKYFSPKHVQMSYMKEETVLKEKRDSFRAFSNDVVLPTDISLQIERIANATRTAHSRKAVLRHVMFYGPPGTGKTMMAKKLATWCELDYAIMSGADIAPLREQAVTELHNLFAWANQTKKGVLLFIDEADAFLASRDGGPMSESLRNALTALLYHTGSSSSRVMLVLATNRPGDLDSAVIDRIDESVQFQLPELSERQLLVNSYFQAFLGQVDSQVSENELKETAKRLDGFSGREISKLMISVQAHMFGSGKNCLEKDLYESVVRHSVKEHAKLTVMARHSTLPTSPKSSFLK